MQMIWLKLIWQGNYYKIQIEWFPTLSYRWKEIPYLAKSCRCFTFLLPNPTILIPYSRLILQCLTVEVRNAGTIDLNPLYSQIWSKGFLYLWTIFFMYFLISRAHRESQGFTSEYDTWKLGTLEASQTFPAGLSAWVRQKAKGPVDIRRSQSPWCQLICTRPMQIMCVM